MTKKYTNPREYYVERLRGQVKEMAEKVSNLEFKIEESDWEPEMDYHKQIDELRIGLDRVRNKIEELEAASDSAWMKVLETAEDQLAELEASLEKATSVLSKILLE
jgi:hypothetical protein